MEMPVMGRLQSASILFAAVYAAMETGPKLLIRLCTITIPIPVMEDCRLEGRPRRRISLKRTLSNTNSDLLNLKYSIFLLTYIKQSTTEIACARTVAMATPATPILRTRTKKRSPAMFRRLEMMRKIRGVVLSPRARRKDAKKL